MYAIAVITDKANHFFHYKEKATCTAAFNQFSNARDKWAANISTYCAIREGYDQVVHSTMPTAQNETYTLTDDYGAVLQTKLNTVVSIFMNNIEAEKEIERTRKIIDMHSDLLYGEAIADDTRLQEAHRKAQARQNLVRPQ